MPALLDVDATTPAQPTKLSVLWAFARPHRGRLVFAFVLGLGVSAAELATPLVTRWVLDSIGSTAGRFVGPILVLAALIVVGTVLSWRQWVMLGSLAEDVVYDARQGMVRRFLRARLIPLQVRSNGELVTRVTSDTVLLREAASSSAVGLVNGTITVVGTLVLMAYLNPLLAAVTIGAIVVIAVIFGALMPAIGRAQEDAQSSLGALGGLLETTLRAIKTVKVAAAEDRQSRALLSLAEESRGHSLRAVRREALVWSVTFSGIQAATLVIVCGGAYLVSIGQLSMSTLVAFLLYAVGLLGPTMELSTHLTTLQAGIAAAGRIRDVQALTAERSGATLAEVRPPDSDAPALSVERVSGRYRRGGPTVLHDVSFEVPRHGHTAIVGPSGAGKTTLFALILKFIEPDAGRLLMAGRPYSDLGIAGVRARLGYVEQDSPLLAGTLRENLVFANQSAAQHNIDDVLRRLQLVEFVEGLERGLDTDVASVTMSGGQRQRVALARALLAEPDVLLLDEVTAQIDGLSEAAVHDVIRHQARQRAVITIAHRLSTVIDADTILVMDRGRIIDRGSHDELIGRCELYRSLVDALRLDSGTHDSLLQESGPRHDS
ncbi:ABC transporter ATP-binding protein [Mycolicibacterium aichiense]|uniref:ABC transporter ATP-binding protein n=1 Tax=Mycolicibacterium aichiense TaxID=1799 RepID=A0AAD1MF93_9MYCO|nr:ABC transporter ATP-binding protein [Mycolicibacterium aichiense]MCV7016257.1 ABC transporter ATP-binding protein [Mycolicibacterium aichiense]BBX09979.1 putative ABC transporter ATP-binding protein [Mycolicibacterium aichiense]STZ26358.1 ABC transporter, transmembrane region [Mycolicibacterium aichiense]